LKQSQNRLSIHQTADASSPLIMLMYFPAFCTRRGKYTLHAHFNAVPIMQSPVNGASHLLFLLQRCLCHKEATQSLRESRPKNLRGFVAQITRAAPIRALQHNCLFSKQRIPCSAMRVWFRPSWKSNRDG